MAVAVAGTLSLTGGAPAEDPCTTSWDGGAGTARWQDALNWSRGRVPGAADVACIPAGASVRQELGGTVAGLGGDGELSRHSGIFKVTGPSELGRLSIEGGTTVLDGDMAVGRLAQSGGVIDGAGRLGADELSWSAGVQQGPGSTSVGGGSLTGLTHTVGAGRVFWIEPDAEVGWEAGGLELRDSAGFVNSGLLDIRGDQDLTGSGGGVIANLEGGTIRKSAGAAETFVAYPLTNDGALAADSGTLHFHGPLISNGSNTAGGDGVLSFGDAHLYERSRTATTGGARVQFTGPVAIDGEYDARTLVDNVAAAVSITAAATAPRLEMKRGFLMGPGSIATPDLAWTGGTMSESGETRIVPGGPGLVVSGTSTHLLAARTLAIAEGAQARVAERSIVLSDGARIENAGRLELADGTKLDQAAGEASPLVHNLPAGVLTKTGAGRASVAPPATNDGTVEASAGTLAFGSITNLDARVLRGGTWLVSATLELPDRVERNAARLTLDGPASVVWDAFGRADGLRALEANEAEGELTVENGRALAPSGDLANSGELVIGRDASVAAARFVQDAGRTTLGSGGSRLTSAAAAADVRGGLLRGVGTVAGGLLNGGEVRPGLSPGRLTVAGDYEQTPAGILEIEIGGVGLADRDLLDVSGAARYAGLLRVATLVPFLPGPLDEFDVVRHASVAGAFDRVEGLVVDDEHRYSGPDYEPEATWLRSSPPVEVSIGDVTVDEGAGEAVFEVRLSQPTRGVAAGFARTADGSAVSPDDYTHTAEPVMLGPDETVGYFRVPIADDEADEPDETFEVELSETYQGDTTATATIVDDDEPAPEPDPDPEPTPDPAPDPTPIPTPDPEPDAEPDPKPDPTPVPDPDPAPDPAPDPPPDPDPVPDPTPLPAPDPAPLPEPAAPPAEDQRFEAPALVAPAVPASPAAPAPAAPPAAPSAGPRATRTPCPDRLSPRSSFRPHRHPILATRASLHFRGIAWERGCGALDRVTVAIARRQGGGTGLCRYLQPSGRLGRVVSCRRPTYVKARGTTRWTFARSGRFRPGTWTARIRAVDRAGNSEKKVLKPNPLSRNFVTFKIR